MKQFDSVPIKVPAKNVFDLSHDVKSSYNFDKIYPILCQPVYPGDTFNCRAEVFMRAMPLLAPVMHNVDMRLYFFYVPMRLVWNENRKKDWKIFITGGEDGMQEAILPYFTYDQLNRANRAGSFNGSLLDHLGFPTVPAQNWSPNNTSAKERVCSLPLRAYQLVWNEYFRNQNVQNEIEFSFDEGQESNSNLAKLTAWRYKCWEKDYFTSCLPFAQRGQAVRLPIEFQSDASYNAPVNVNAAVMAGQTSPAGGLKVSNDSQVGSLNVLAVDSNQSLNGTVTLQGSATIDAAQLSFTGLSIGTISDFRYCLRLQQWLENNARCGSRYIEQLLSHFGVVSSDARLQRPELLGGGKIPLLFTDVEQNSFGRSTDDPDDVLGNLGGKGTLYGKTSGFKKYFEEHGILLGVLTIIPRTSYQNMLPRVWTAFDKTDWYFPEFANLGEQAVLNKEVYFDPTNNSAIEQTPNEVFGYQGRFTELRYIPSSVHGEMKGTLQSWHLGRSFSAQPSLNSDFVTAKTRANIFAVEDVAAGDYDPFVCQIHLDIKAVRPLPKYAIPTL